MATQTTNTIGGRKPPEFTDQHAAKYLRRGFDALMAGEHGDASDCAALVLKYKPKLTEAHFLVGLIAVEAQDWGMVQKAFRAVVNLKEDHAAAWAQLARVYVKTGHFNTAEKALALAVEHGSDDPLVLDVIGTAYTLIGDQETALKNFTAACALADNPMFEMNRAQCLLYLGKFDETRASLEKVIKAIPHHPTAHFTLSRLEKATNTEHIEEILSIIKRFPVDNPQISSLYFGLAKEYEDLEMWPDAFEAYSSGTSLRRTEIEFDEAYEIETFKALEETFTKEWLEGIGEGFNTAAPIFIIGQPRTGTTLTERILTARDDVHSAGELPQFGMNLKRMTEAASSNMISAEVVREAANLDVKALGQLFMDTTKSVRGDKPRFVDKLPLNYLYAPLIAAALPNAKIIHVTRGAMDSCFSSFKQLFAEAYFHSYEQGEMARHHVRYRKLMEHYTEVLGDKMHTVAYEDVVADTEGEARKLIEFLELEWQDASLDFHKQKTAVTTASAAQVREKAHTRSVDKWRKFEDELAPMLEIITAAGYV